MNCNGWSEVGIYKRKQESKKTRNQETKKVIKRNKQVFFFFLGLFLGRVLVFLIAFLVEFLFILFSYFLVFFNKFPPLFVCR